LGAALTGGGGGRPNAGGRTWRGCVMMSYVMERERKCDVHTSFTVFLIIGGAALLMVCYKQNK
jgi:hypothetical protein